MWLKRAKNLVKIENLKKIAKELSRSDGEDLVRV